LSGLRMEQQITHDALETWGWESRIKSGKHGSMEASKQAIVLAREYTPKLEAEFGFPLLSIRVGEKRWKGD